MKENRRVDFTVHPGSALTGSLSVPGDKSISHRALILGAIAEGTTRITGFLDSEDTSATMNALHLMGVRIEREEDDVVCIHGVGLKGLSEPCEMLNLGNSGTSVRLLTGLLSGQAFDSQLQGDKSLMQRPMRRITEPLLQMGADIRCSDTGKLPVHITGNRKLKGMTYRMPVASAQLKSAILLAGLYAYGRTCIVEPAVTRDHSERMLSQFGCQLEKNDNKICLEPGALQAQSITVPGDISSAAFFMVAASIVPGSNLLLEGIGMNPTRNALIQILQLMGADITVEEEKVLSAEPVANLRIRYSRLKGVEIPAHLVPIAIDELPVLMVAAACASGETLLTGAMELRVKESDRIKAMCEGLTRTGIDVEEFEDGMRVRGGEIKGGIVDSFTDHRIAMSFSVAALVASDAVTIHDCANVNTSFPGFEDCFTRLGLTLRREEHV